jgi:hypothetical protein
MSRTAHIILIVDKADDRNVEQLALWVASDEATDLGGRELLEADTGPGGPGSSPLPPVEPPGQLNPLYLDGTDHHDGPTAGTVAVWGAITTNLHRRRFLAKLRTTAWVGPDRLQLLYKDEADTYFRCYILQDGQLRNVMPEPPDEGYEIDW